MRSSVVVVVVLAGCQSNVREASPARRGDQPCSPVTHDAAETRRGAPLFEAYRVLGASDDGKRIALMLTHMGPGSGQPVGGVHVFEAGSAQEVFAKNYFQIQGTEADLSKVEHGITDELAPDVAAAGVDIGKHVPEHVAWCSDASGTIYTGDGALELRVTHTPCPNYAKHDSVSWQLCSKDGAHCIGGTPNGCIDAQVSVHDIVRAGTTDWIIVDLATRPFQDQEFHLFQTAGGALSGS